MIGKLTLAAVFAAVALPAIAQDPAHMPGEEPVDPYAVSEANAGAAPFRGADMIDAFHGPEGVNRIVDDMLDRSVADPRIAGIFAATDMVRLRRTLKEQFCYILNGGCAYSGRSMQDAHDDIGLQPADMGALVEHLQLAMDAEGVPFRTQNRFLAKLAPMRRDVVTR
jgi:hemoglobin